MSHIRVLIPGTEVWNTESQHQLTSYFKCTFYFTHMQLAHSKIQDKTLIRCAVLLAPDQRWWITGIFFFPYLLDEFGDINKDVVCVWFYKSKTMLVLDRASACGPFISKDENVCSFGERATVIVGCSKSVVNNSNNFTFDIDPGICVPWCLCLKLTSKKRRNHMFILPETEEYLYSKSWGQTFTAALAFTWMWPNESKFPLDHSLNMNQNL